MSGVCLRLRASALERVAASQGRVDRLHKGSTGEGASLVDPVSMFCVCGIETWFCPLRPVCSGSGPCHFFCVRVCTNFSHLKPKSTVFS